MKLVYFPVIVQQNIFCEIKLYLAIKICICGNAIRKKEMQKFHVNQEQNPRTVFQNSSGILFLYSIMVLSLSDFILNLSWKIHLHRRRYCNKSFIPQLLKSETPLP